MKTKQEKVGGIAYQSIVHSLISAACFHCNIQLNFCYSFSAKRAAWRWARDRARIASRWTWLLSQISDLEYRIRQHHELYLLLKKNNGPVTFENSPHDETAMLDHTLIPLAPPQQSVNGYRGTLPGNLPTDDDNEKTDDDQGCTAARTRAFRANTFRKRKLLQSTNLHKISKKSARTW